MRAVLVVVQFGWGLLLFGCTVADRAQTIAGHSPSQPSLAKALDRDGRTFVGLGYADLVDGVSTMGLAIQPPHGEFRALPPLTAPGSDFHPVGDGQLAAAPHGSNIYYAALLSRTSSAPGVDVADGVAMATIDVASGAEVVGPLRRIDDGVWPGWDEPAIVAVRPDGAAEDSIIVAGSLIGTDDNLRFQDLVGVFASHDGGQTFGATQTLLAPRAHRVYGRRADTVVRPLLRADPRPGQACHAYLVFGVYYPTAFTRTRGVAPPDCIFEDSGCRAIAEAETLDCGDTWSKTRYIVVDSGAPEGPDFRGFSYTVAADGSRLVAFGDEDADDAPILVKRAAADGLFAVQAMSDGVLQWSDGAVETVVDGPASTGGAARRFRPTLAAGDFVTAMWIEEDRGSQTALVRSSLAMPSGWSASVAVDLRAGQSCDAFPEDDYLAVMPFAGRFLYAWTSLSGCDGGIDRSIIVVDGATP